MMRGERKKNCLREFGSDRRSMVWSVKEFGSDKRSMVWSV